MRGAGSQAGCDNEDWLTRASKRHHPGRRKDKEGFWKMFSAKDMCPVVTPGPWKVEESGDPLPRFYGDRERPACCLASTQPRRACLAKRLCHSSQNGTLSEARSIYK